jgi:DNA (cytosine-5)-methyltransferase 1
MVWENVPGAFSSNKGDDFRIVLEELAKVKDPNAVIPMPEKWTNHGCIMGDGWSIAWRVLDAQFWGVPQRRRRIALVADFGGHSAPEILFVRKSVSGNTDEGEQKRKEAPSNATGGFGADDRDGAICYGISSYDSNAMKSSNPNSGIYVADTARTLDLNGGTPACNQGGMAVVAAVDFRNATEDSVNGVLQSAASHSLNGNNVVRTRYIVRRLTPLECERLQGYPDGWTDIGEWTDSNGKKRQTSDTARFKALGNSISLPPWKWVLKRLCACYERDATMASLFDGIGGFPYLWEQLNGKGTCLWASEIEEFPIAVTKVRIGGHT